MRTRPEVKIVGLEGESTGARIEAGRRVDVLVTAAVGWEVDELVSRLASPRRATVGRRAWTEGELEGLRVAFLETGVGKVNTALALGAALERVRPGLILSAGVAGAYPSSGLEPGQVAAASEEVCADEGVEAQDGLHTLEATGMALWEDGSGRRFFDRFPVDPPAARLLGEAAGGRIGPFGTVSTVTGTASRARSLEERFGLICENMEGAAAAHAALSREVAFAEVRGVSNRVGPRDRAAWKLREAAGACQHAVRDFLAAWAAAHDRRRHA